MDFAYTAEDEAFRDELRGWLDENLPKFLAEWGDDDDRGDADGAAGRAAGSCGAMERRRAWQRTLNEGRWAAINWPTEWGGRDATVTQNVIYSEEMAQARTPGIYNANGLWQIGPMIIRWGTDEQKDRWIPNILNADDHWCQGFSEPEAGSDLANLRTHRRSPTATTTSLNGQKIWISTAHIAKWGLFLVRTDPDRHRARGASTRASPRSSSTWRPPASSAGRSATSPARRCSTRCSSPTPACRSTYRLGDEGAGWQVAMGTLGHERVGTAGLAITMRADLDAMISLARADEPRRARRPRAARPHRPGPHRHRVHAAAQLPGAVEDPARARRTGPRCRWPSCSGATSRRRSPSWPSTCSARPRMLAKGGPDAVDGGAWNRLYVFQRYTSIGAGTTEVQKNIIADKALNMGRR